MEVQKLYVSLALRAQEFQAGLQEAQQKAEGFASDVGAKIGGALQTASIIGVAALAAIGAGIVGLGAAALNLQGDMHQATNAIIVGTGASGEALESMRQSVVNLAGSAHGLNTDMGTIGAVMADLNTRLGITGDELESVTGSVLDFSRVTGTDAVGNVRNITRVMGDWGIESADAAALMDTLFGASQAFGIGVDSLSQKVVQFGAPLRLMGFSIEESIALFGKWEKEGVNTELALGSLRIAAGKFADEGLPLRESLMATFDSIKNNEDATMALAEAMEVFGARAGPDMAAAIREGRFDLEGALAALQATEGGLADAAERTIGFREQWQIAMNQAKLSLLPLGEALGEAATVILPVFQGAFEGVMGVVGPIIEGAAGAISNLFEGLAGGEDVLGDVSNFAYELALAFGASQETATKLFFEVQELWGGLMTLKARFEEIAEPVIKFIQENVKLQDVLIVMGALILATVIPAVVSLVVSMAPIILVVGAVIAVVALLRTAWENDWGGIQAKTAAVGEFIRGVIDTVRTVIQTFLTNIRAWWEENGEAILSSVRNVWGLIQGLIDGVVEHIQLVVQLFQAAFRGDWEEFGQLIFRIWENAWETVVEFLTGLWDMVKPKVVALWEGIKRFFTETDWASLGRNIIDGIINGIRNAAGALLDVISGIAQEAREWFGRAIGEGSPARLFIPAGEAIVEGIVAGINSAAPLLERAMDGLSRLASLGGGFGGVFQAQVLDPLEQRVNDLQQRADDYGDALLDMARSLGFENFDINSGGSQLFLEQFLGRGDLTLEQRSTAQVMLSFLRERWSLTGELMIAQDELIRQQERLAELERQRAQLNFLQQQWELLKLIKDYGLDVSLLSGLEFGLGADPGRLMDAMVEAMRRLILTAETELLGGTGGSPALRLAMPGGNGNVTGSFNNTTVNGGYHNHIYGSSIPALEELAVQGR